MSAHVTLPNIYKVPGYGITDFTENDIKVGKIFRVMSDRGEVLERQVIGIDQPYKGRVQLLKVNEGDTAHVSISVFVMVMRGRGIPEGKGDKE